MLGIAPALSCARSSTTPSTERDNGLLTQHALEQVAEGGASAVSLNAIAKAMGMSGPAIYRYFASRDELLASLVTAGYDELTAALEEAERAAVRRTPARRLAAVIAAYRPWALAHPQHYAMLFGVRPPGSTDSTEAIVAVHGGMLVLLRLLGELSEGQPPTARPDRLVDELVQWSARRDDDGSSSLALRLGVLTWTRMHGIVSLELAEVFASWASPRSCSSRPRPRRSSMRPRSEQIAPSASVPCGRVRLVVRSRRNVQVTASQPLASAISGVRRSLGLLEQKRQHAHHSP